MDFSLATQKLNRSGGGSGGLRASTLSQSSGLSGAYNNARLNVNAGQIQATPYQLPKVIADQTSASIQNFMGVAAEAAFNYQDRESTLAANQAYLDFEKKAREGYSGYDTEDGFVPGYVQSQGAQAIGAFDQYQVGLEDSMKEILSEMEPRVKQKALIKMQSVSGQYLNKAATHRTTQLKLAEEQQRYDIRKTIQSEIVANPDSIDQINPITRTTGKDRFYNTFNKKSEADKAWFNLMEDSTGRAYQKSYRDAINGGVSETEALSFAANQANAFYEGVSGPELQTEPGIQESIQRKLKKWNEDSLTSVAQQERTSIARARLAREITQERSEATLMSREFNGDVIPLSDLGDQVESGLVSQKFAKRYANDHHSVELNTTDSDIMGKAFEFAKQSVAENPNINVREFLDEFDFRSQKDYDAVKGYIETLKNPLQNQSYNRLEKAGKSLVNVQNLFGKRDEEAEILLNIEVSKIIVAGLQSGKSEVQLLDEIQERIPRKSSTFSNLLAFPRGERPENVEQLQEAVRVYYDEAVADRGNKELTDRYLEAVRLAEQYEASIEETRQRLENRKAYEASSGQ